MPVLQRRLVQGFHQNAWSYPIKNHRRLLRFSWIDQDQRDSPATEAIQFCADFVRLARVVGQQRHGVDFFKFVADGGTLEGRFYDGVARRTPRRGEVNDYRPSFGSRGCKSFQAPLLPGQAAWGDFGDGCGVGLADGLAPTELA